MRVCPVKIIYTNDMSMGPQNKPFTPGGHAKRISPNNSIGQKKRPVLADYLSHAFYVYTTTICSFLQL